MKCGKTFSNFFVSWAFKTHCVTVTCVPLEVQGKSRSCSIQCLPDFFTFPVLKTAHHIRTHIFLPQFLELFSGCHICWKIRFWLKNWSLLHENCTVELEKLFHQTTADHGETSDVIFSPNFHDFLCDRHTVVCWLLAQQNWILTENVWCCMTTARGVLTLKLTGPCKNCTPNLSGLIFWSHVNNQLVNCAQFSRLLHVGEY